jgi:hypothetical protein
MIIYRHNKHYSAIAPVQGGNEQHHCHFHYVHHLEEVGILNIPNTTLITRTLLAKTGGTSVIQLA